MRRNPVHNHADARLVAIIHKIFKIIRCAVTAGGGKVARHLIAPAPVKGILHHRQQLHMSVVHVFQVGNQLLCQFAVIVRIAVLISTPASRVHFVNIHSRLDGVFLGFFIVPSIIVPLIAGQIVNLAAIGRARFRMERIGVGFEQQLIVLRGNAVFVDVKLSQSSHPALPNTAFRVDVSHGCCTRHPAVEIAHYTDRFRPRSPYAKAYAGAFPSGFKVSAEKALCLKVISLLEQINRNFMLALKVRCHRLCLFQLRLPPFDTFSPRRNVLTRSIKKPSKTMLLILIIILIFCQFFNTFLYYIFKRMAKNP